MFCIQCGIELPQNAKFCMNCGIKIDNTAEISNNVNMLISSESDSDDQEGMPLYDTTKYIVAKDTDVVKGMLNGSKLENYKNNHLKNGKFLFKIKDNFVEYPERIVMYINAIYYNNKLRDHVETAFLKEYKKSVVDMESYFDKGISIQVNTCSSISEATVKLLVASGVMTIDKTTIERLMVAEVGMLIDETLMLLYSAYIEISKFNPDADFDQFKQIVLEESGDYYYMFAIASEELRKALNNIPNSRDRKRVQSILNKKFTSEITLEKYIKIWNDMTMKAFSIYTYFIEEEKGIDFSFNNDDRLRKVAENAMKYSMDDEYLLLESLCKALSDSVEYSYILEFLTDYYYQDDYVLGQLSELAGFLLYESEFKKWKLDADNKKKEGLSTEQDRENKKLPEENAIDVVNKIDVVSEESSQIESDVTDKRKKIKRLDGKRAKEVLEKHELEKELNEAKKLPENTITEIEIKIDKIREEGNKIQYNVEDDIKRLDEAKAALQKYEIEKDYIAALQLEEDTIDKIEIKIKKVIEEATKIGCDFEEDVKLLHIKKDELLQRELEDEKDEIRDRICSSLILAIDKAITKNNLTNELYKIYQIFLDDFKNHELFEVDDAYLEDMYDLISSYEDKIDLSEDEIPLVFYRDSTSKNVKDSFFITTEKVVLSNMGRIESVALKSIKNLIPVEKMLGSAILINDEYKLCLTLLGRKKVGQMLDCLDTVIKTGIIMSNLMTDLSKEQLEDYYKLYVTDEMLEELQSVEKSIAAYNRSKNLVADFIHETEGKFFKKLLSKDVYHKSLHPACDMTSEEVQQYWTIKSIYDSIDAEENILFFYDNTMLGSMKESFVLTDRAIHFKSHRLSNGCVKLKDIESIKVKLISLMPNMIINGMITIPVRFLSDDSAQEFVSFIRSMRYKDLI